KELGERLVSLGAIRSALDIFERLELWENVISCYQMLEKEKQAEEVVQKLLEQDPTSPKYLCLLGDVKHDPTYYEQAWEVSGQRYARAMRSLGSWHFKKGNFVESVECYNKGLSINPLFEHSWFVMGCAALRAEDWENAELAFRKTVQLDSENGEAWTNLASVYIKIQKKRDAWRALREALRHHHDNSRIWDNYLFTSVDLGEYLEAIMAMNRIFDIRSNVSRTSQFSDNTSWFDLGVLKILVSVAIEAHKQPEEGALSTLPNKLNSLFVALTGKITTSTDLYEAYSTFLFGVDRYAKGLSMLEKSYRLLLHSPKLLEDESFFAETVAKVGVYVQALKDYGSHVDEDTNTAVYPDWKYQARMVLRTLVGRTKDAFEGTAKHDELKKWMEWVKSQE
ncbi:hypothetical protein HDU76_005889, partial [Blyttiomyces sp. JEL0837]